MNAPLQTVLAKDHRALAEPFIMPVTHAGGEERCRSIDAPLPTVTTAKRGEFAIAQVIPGQVL